VATSAARTPDITGIHISITREGLHSIGLADLANVFDVSQNKARRWIRGNKLSLTHQDLPVAWQKAAGANGLYFYAEKIDSPYTETNVYQLAKGRGKKVTTIKGKGPDPIPTRDGFTTSVHVEQDQWATTAIFDDPDDDYWQWDYLFAGYAGMAQKDFTVPAPGLLPDSPGALTIHFKGGLAGDHTVKVGVNGTTVGNARFRDIDSYSVTLEISAGVLVGGDNTVTLTAVEPSAGISLVYLDSFDLVYQKTYTAIDDRLTFKGEERSVVSVDGFSQKNIRVYDVSDPLNIVRIEALSVDPAGDDTYRVALWNDDPEATYLAIGEDAVQIISPDNLAGYDTLNLMDTDQWVDYLVIAPDALLEGAKALADYRQGCGLFTLVVRLQQIYDQFNYGMANPEAVKDFLAYAWHNWRHPPRYVVRVGQGSFDYKDVKGTGETLMPPLMVSTPWGLFASENRLADVDGTGDGVPEMIMGLLPAGSNETLLAMVDKIRLYESTSGVWKNRVLMVADNPDGGGDFPAASDALAARVADGYTTESIDLGDLSLSSARQALFSGFDRGAFLVNYIGHAAVDRLAQEGLLTQTDVERMTNLDRLPILVGMTCVAGHFDIPGFDAIGESLVTKENGGAIAAWVPTGFSSNALANVLNHGLFSAIFDNNERVLGDAVLAAMNAYKSQHAAGGQFMLDIYTLIGDPALVLQ
jgi:hypothetical protein